jgi:tRNA(fMet)-specific endonuclease VapC
VLTEAIVERAAEIYADLYRRGALIGDADVLIAASAMVNGLALVTNNNDHFKRIIDLKIENWLLQ